MDNIFGEVPAYTTIGYWAQELGLSVYKESCTLFKGKRYALVVDESMMIGSEKMLLTLAVAADFSKEFTRMILIFKSFQVMFR